MSLASSGPASPYPRSRVTRGSLTRLAMDNQPEATLEFQYNPETVTRTRAGQWDPRKRKRDPKAAQALQQKSQLGAAGAAALLADAETISFQLVFDATEALLNRAPGGSDEKFDPVRDGVLPQLAFLEVVSLGMSPQARAAQNTAKKGEIRPIRPSELLLRLGGSRAFPCVLTDLTITEQKFNPALVPIRARADLKLTVLEPMEVSNLKEVQQQFDQLLARRQELAGYAGGQALTLDRLLGGGKP